MPNPHIGAILKLLSFLKHFHCGGHITEHTGTASGAFQIYYNFKLPSDLPLKLPKNFMLSLRLTENIPIVVLAFTGYGRENTSVMIFTNTLYW